MGHDHDATAEMAAAAVDRFCLSLGAVAGDIALAQGASGVVIAGGLGLALARRFVELHGGSIRVESAPGHGSTFAFILPERELEAV